MGEKGVLTPMNFLFGNLIFFRNTGHLYSFISLFFLLKKTKDYDLKKKEVKLFSEVFNNSHIVIISLLVLVSLLLLLLLLYFEFNLETLLYKNVFLVNTQNHSKSIVAISNVLRGVPLIMLLYFKLNGKKSLQVEILLIALVLITNFPSGISKYRVAVNYLPLIIIYFESFFNKNYFTVFFISSFLFPYLHHFRYNKKSLLKM